MEKQTLSSSIVPAKFTCGNEKRRDVGGGDDWTLLPVGPRTRVSLRIKIRGISDRRTAPIRCSGRPIASSGSAQLGWVRQETERTDPVHRARGPAS